VRAARLPAPRQARWSYPAGTFVDPILIFCSSLIGLAGRCRRRTGRAGVWYRSICCTKNRSARIEVAQVIRRASRETGSCRFLSPPHPVRPNPVKLGRAVDTLVCNEKSCTASPMRKLLRFEFHLVSCCCAIPMITFRLRARARPLKLRTWVPVAVGNTPGVISANPAPAAVRGMLAMFWLSTKFAHRDLIVLQQRLHALDLNGLLSRCRLYREFQGGVI